MPILVVTRPEHAARRFADAVLSAVDAQVVISPRMRIEVLEAQLPPHMAVILTSENGAAQAKRLGVAAGTVAYCIGNRTAQAARSAGLEPVSADGDADALVALLTEIRPQGTLCHIRGEHARGDICARLNALGITCSEVIAYAQTAADPTPQAIAALTGTEPVVLPLFSPRSALLIPLATAPLHIIAISAAVAEHCAALGADTITVADRPDGDAMVLATCRRISAINGGAVA